MSVTLEISCDLLLHLGHARLREIGGQVPANVLQIRYNSHGLHFAPRSSRVLTETTAVFCTPTAALCNTMVTEQPNYTNGLISAISFVDREPRWRHCEVQLAAVFVCARFRHRI